METLNKIKEFGKKCKRVWIVLKKPTNVEFNLISKVTAIGILILGVIGFIISLIMALFV